MIALRIKKTCNMAAAGFALNNPIITTFGKCHSKLYFHK